jgi:hypothetical protein
MSREGATCDRSVENDSSVQVLEPVTTTWALFLETPLYNKIYSSFSDCAVRIVNKIDT